MRLCTLICTHTHTHRYHCSVSKLQLRELQLCLCPFQEKVSTQRHSLTSGKAHRRAALPRTSSRIICTACKNTVCLSCVCVHVNADLKPLEDHLSVVRATQSVLDDALTNHHCVFSECLEITVFKGTKQFDFCLWTVCSVHVVKHTSLNSVRLSHRPHCVYACDLHHTNTLSLREERRGAVAVRISYSQFLHPIVFTCRVIGFETREGAAAVEKEVKWAKLIIWIWSLNKSAMFTLTHVRLVAAWVCVISPPSRSSLQTTSSQHELICGLWTVTPCLSSHVAWAALCLWKMHETIIGIIISSSRIIIIICIYSYFFNFLMIIKLTLLVCIASGGRDRRGGPVLTFPSRSNHDRIRTDDLRRLIAYLAGIPRLHTNYICFITCGWLQYQ